MIAVGEVRQSSEREAARHVFKQVKISLKDVRDLMLEEFGLFYLHCLWMLLDVEPEVRGR